MKIDIIQEKQKDREDSFFYEGTIAQVVKPNGTTLYLTAQGDIGISIGEEFYDNGNILDAILKYNLTDEILRTMEESGKLEWRNNNWFEVNWTKKGSNEMECDIGEVVWNYDDAIQLLKDYYGDKTK